MDLNEDLINACIEGNVDQVKLLLNEGANDYNTGLSYACYGGYNEHKEIAKLLISLAPNDINSGLFNACVGGKIEMVKLMILYGADNFNTAIWYSKNNKEISLLLLSKGADINNCLVELNFEDIYYLLHACAPLRELGIKEFGKFSNIALECQDFLLEFQNTLNNFFIKDIANIITNF